MTLTKSYITDESGKITNVVLDSATFRHLEEILLDRGLLDAMEEIDNEETVEYEQVKKLIQAL